MALEAVGMTVEAGGRALLLDVSLRLQAGRVLGIIGPNGAGKSTLVKACAGLLAPTAGSVTLLGRPLANWPARERAARIGYLPQHFLPHWDYSVRELLRLGVERGGTRTVPTTVAAAALAFELQPFLDRRWSNLSGGERGRALAASVLAPAPAVVLADEPAAALDMGQAAALMMRLNAQAAAGAAVAIVVHDLNLAARWCDRLLILAGGQCVTEGPASEVLCSPALDDVFGVRLERLIARDGTIVLVPCSTVDVETDGEEG
ncbi:iron-hydroxamate transporter ATP-binding protein [Siccirubricoccus deserti]|nr:iron-hydroxamate transporter ATP-binding protein [Siccirubricoccus deserti]